MRAGVIEQIGVPLDVYDNPVNLFVAEFIGSPAMNLIHGTVLLSSGRPILQTDNGSEILLPARDGLRDGQSVIFGIRPEHMSLEKEDGISTALSVVEPTGPEIHLYCAFEGRDLCAITKVRRDYTPGEAITLTPDLERAHVFDAASGVAV